MAGYTNCSSDQVAKLFIDHVAKYNHSLSGKIVFTPEDSFVLYDTAKELKKRCRAGADQINPLLEQFSIILKDMTPEQLSNPKVLVGAFNKGFSYTAYHRAAIQRRQALPRLAR